MNTDTTAPKRRRVRPTTTPARKRPAPIAGVPMSNSAMSDDTAAVSALKRRYKSSQRVRYFVRQADNSDADLAKSLGVSETTFKEWHQGLREVPPVILATMELAFLEFNGLFFMDSTSLSDLFSKYRSFAEF